MTWPACVQLDYCPACESQLHAHTTDCYAGDAMQCTRPAYFCCERYWTPAMFAIRAANRISIRCWEDDIAFKVLVDVSRILNAQVDEGLRAELLKVRVERFLARVQPL